MSIQVVDYDPTWPALFEALKQPIWNILDGIALSIEHVGSTSVPGLAAKPIIDMSIVVPSQAELPIAIERLASLGYTHVGNRGIEGREAFERPEGTPAHNLYLCPQGSLGLRNHLAVRDYLRSHPEMANEYGRIKKELAEAFRDDIDRYVDGKTDIILKILESQELTDEQRNQIEAANRLR